MGDGINLAFAAANLSQYFFKLDFFIHVHPKVRKALHLIPKHLKHVDVVTGQLVEDDEEHSWRFELWVFDAFEHAANSVGFEVSRQECSREKSGWRRFANHSTSGTLAAASILGLEGWRTFQ